MHARRMEASNGQARRRRQRKKKERGSLAAALTRTHTHAPIHTHITQVYQSKSTRARAMREGSACGRWQGKIVCFRFMHEAGLRQWVEANPGRVNDRDDEGNMPLYVAALRMQSLSLVLWLLDEKGASVNATTSRGWTACMMLHPWTSSVPYRGANPTLQGTGDWTALMWQVYLGNVNVVARLLEDPRVRATVNFQDEEALDHACYSRVGKRTVASNVRLLLQAGADPTITDREGRTPLACLRQYHPTYLTTIALLERALADMEKTWLIVKARIFIMAATSSAAPSCLEDRVARCQPLPCVAQASVTGSKSRKTRKRRRELHSMLAFLLGIGGGPKGEGMPREVFRVVLDLLMPGWDPLRRGLAGMEPPL